MDVNMKGVSIMAFKLTGRLVHDQSLRGEQVLILEHCDADGKTSINPRTGTPYYRVLRSSPKHAVHYELTNPCYARGAWQFHVNRHGIITSVTREDGDHEQNE